MTIRPITFIVEFEVQPGREADFEALLPLLEDAASQEPGTVEYVCYRGPNRNAMCFYERYQDSAAAIAHTEAFAQDLGRRYMEMITPKSVIMLGPATEELAAQFAPVFAGSVPGVTGAGYAPMPGAPANT